MEIIFKEERQKHTFKNLNEELYNELYALVEEKVKKER